MPLLAIVWVAILQALALATPTSLRSADVGLSQRSRGETGVVQAGPTPASERWAPGSGSRDERLRAPAPQPLRIVGRRAPDQRPNALRPLTPLAGAPRAVAQGLRGTGRRGEPRSASHAVSARGGHLPYFPTAPPLQR